MEILKITRDEVWINPEIKTIDELKESLNSVLKSIRKKEMKELELLKNRTCMQKIIDWIR